MKTNSDIKFTEPQSMNYDKKITQAYVEYENKRSESKNKQEHEREEPNDLIEDLLFEIPAAAEQIHQRLSDADFMKRMKKEAKAHVKEQIENGAYGQSRYTIEADVHRIDSENTTKKKMSPRSLAKVKFQTNKRIRQEKRDIVIQDDEYSMGQLTKFLKSLRIETLKGKKDNHKADSAAEKKRTVTANAARQDSERTGTAMTE